MKIALIHTRFTSMGGGERLCLSIVEGLNRVGLVPDLYVYAPINSEQVEAGYGKRLNYNAKVISVPKLKGFQVYQQLLYMLKIRVNDYDWIIDTSGIYFPPLLRSKNYIVYVHNPIMYKRKNDRYEAGFWRLYIAPYLFLIKRGIKGLSEDKIISNSEFTRKRVKKYWGKDSITIYPPASIEDFISHEKTQRSGVVTVGRFSPEKEHLMQLEIASRLPEMEFRICGTTKTFLTKRTFDSIKEKAKATGLRNVTFYPDLPLKDIVDLINHSRYFLHTMKDEDFGISICEAIAGGCLPVVYDNGGPVEIVPLKELRFENVEGAIRILKSLERSYPQEKAWNELFNHIQQYKEELFQQRILETIGLDLPKP